MKSQAEVSSTQQIAFFPLLHGIARLTIQMWQARSRRQLMPHWTVGEYHGRNPEASMKVRVWIEDPRFWYKLVPCDCLLYTKIEYIKFMWQITRTRCVWSMRGAPDLFALRCYGSRMTSRRTEIWLQQRNSPSTNICVQNSQLILQDPRKSSAAQRVFSSIWLELKSSTCWGKLQVLSQWLLLPKHAITKIDYDAGSWGIKKVCLNWQSRTMSK